MNDDQCIELISNHIRIFPDFPKRGVLFRDICSALQNGDACKAIKQILVNYVQKNHPDIDVIVGVEARGFLFSLLLATEMGCSCVLARKPGKLPGDCDFHEYTSEYGGGAFEIQKNSIKSGQKVLIVDDLLATGGTVEAIKTLVERTGGQVVKCLFIIELISFAGGARIGQDIVHSFLKYD